MSKIQQISDYLQANQAFDARCQDVSLELPIQPLQININKNLKFRLFDPRLMTLVYLRRIARQLQNADQMTEGLAGEYQDIFTVLDLPILVSDIYSALRAIPSFPTFGMKEALLKFFSRDSIAQLYEEHRSDILGCKKILLSYDLYSTYLRELIDALEGADIPRIETKIAAIKNLDRMVPRCKDIEDCLMILERIAHIRELRKALQLVNIPRIKGLIAEINKFGQPDADLEGILETVDNLETATKNGLEKSKKRYQARLQSALLFNTFYEDQIATLKERLQAYFKLMTDDPAIFQLVAVSQANIPDQPWGKYKDNPAKFFVTLGCREPSASLEKSNDVQEIEMEMTILRAKDSACPPSPDGSGNNDNDSIPSNSVPASSRTIPNPFRK